MYIIKRKKDVSKLILLCDFTDAFDFILICKAILESKKK